MNVRPFDWRDLPALHRYRNQSVFLHSSLVLTRGPMLIPGVVLSSFTQATGIYTSICMEKRESNGVLIGQVLHEPGTQIAHLTFLTPDEALQSPSLTLLLEHLAVQMGEQGAFRLLAEVDEGAATFEALRQAGFAVYTRQRIWKITNQLAEQSQPGSWQPMAEQDAIPLRSLYNNVVPGLVQQVESFPSQKPHGMVYRSGDDLIAYAGLNYGLRGIWVQPLVHPDAEHPLERLSDLVSNLPYRFSRPVYFCIRSYLSWLEPFLEEMGAEAGPRQAVMVKHLVVQQKAVRTFALPALEKGQPEVSAPIARSENHQY